MWDFTNAMMIVQKAYQYSREVAMDSHDRNCVSLEFLVLKLL